jgi:NitT/TauT family transport system permease protein
MAVDTSAHGIPPAETPAAAIAGLDNLDLVQVTPRLRLPEKIWAAVWPKLLALAIVLGAWQLVYLSGWKSPAVFPGPATVLPDLWGQAQHGLLWSAIGTTMKRAVIGFGLALIIGSFVGALVSRIKPLRAAVGSLITGLQTMPSIAWFPFAIIFFGLNTSAILFVIVLGAAPSIANGLIAGVDYTPPLLLRAGKTMGLRRIALYRHLIDMPGAMTIMIVILVLGIMVDGLFNIADGRIRRRWGLADPASLS